MHQDQEPIDSRFKVVTPENIAFSYEVAGPFRRLIAFLLDLAIRLLIMLVVYLLMIFLFIAVGQFDPTTAGDMLSAAGLVVYFLFDWLYMAGFEYFWNGKTPGKWVLNLRVLTDEGEPINALQAGLRNVLRYVDMMPMYPIPLVALREESGGAPVLLTFMLALLVPLFTRRLQRIGDLVSGTMVVIEDRAWLMKVARIEDQRAKLLADYIPPNYVMPRSTGKAIAIYVERRRYFTTARRREIARHLAQPLLARFGLPEDTSYDLLLCAMYYRSFLSEQSSDGTSGDSTLLKNVLLQERPEAAANSPFKGVASAGDSPSSPNSQELDVR
ncbi:MAG: RDD family protein [Pirellulaceae bacterium]